MCAALATFVYAKPPLSNLQRSITWSFSDQICIALEAGLLKTTLLAHSRVDTNSCKQTLTLYMKLGQSKGWALFVVKYNMKFFGSDMHSAWGCASQTPQVHSISSLLIQVIFSHVRLIPCQLTWLIIVIGWCWLSLVPYTELEDEVVCTLQERVDLL